MHPLSWIGRRFVHIVWKYFSVSKWVRNQSWIITYNFYNLSQGGGKGVRKGEEGIPDLPLPFAPFGGGVPDQPLNPFPTNLPEVSHLDLLCDRHPEAPDQPWLTLSPHRMSHRLKNFVDTWLDLNFTSSGLSTQKYLPIHVGLNTLWALAIFEWFSCVYCVFFSQYVYLQKFNIGFQLFSSKQNISHVKKPRQPLQFHFCTMESLNLCMHLVSRCYHISNFFDYHVERTRKTKN